MLLMLLFPKYNPIFSKSWYYRTSHLNVKNAIFIVFLLYLFMETYGTNKTKIDIKE